MVGDHTSGMAAVLALVTAAGGTDGTIPPDTVPTVDFTVSSVGGALVLACIAAIPLGVSLWALLDAARRPRWAWALSGRRQVVWMAWIMFGVMSVVGGLLISGWYLTKVRPQIAAAETGSV